MLSAFRSFAKSPIATVLLGLLVISFGVWGIRDVFKTANFSDAVVKAAGRPAVTEFQFRNDFDRMKASQERQAGQSISTADAVKAGFDTQLLQDLAATESAAGLMTAEGINPSDQLVVEELRKNNSFFNPVTGLFDKNVYLRIINEAKMTEAEAERDFRDEIAIRQYGVALGTALKAPRIYSLLQAAYLHEGRDFSVFTLAPNAVPAPPAATDAVLNDYIRQNPQRFTKPEMRQLSLLRMSAAMLATTLQVPEADVQKRFDFEKDALNTPEKRTVIAIPVKDAKIGADIAAKLKAGGDPEAVAKAAGLQPATYGQTPKSAMPDRKIAEAAFALKSGEVTGPIQGELGLVVVKVTDITPGKTVTLADARGKIEQDLKQAQAKEKIYEVVQKYDDAHSGGASMAEAAKAAGEPVTPLPPITATGQSEDKGRANLPPKIMQTAFTLPAGGESDVMDLGQGEYWVVHVDKIIPPTLITLGENINGKPVHEQIAEMYTIEDLSKRLKARSDALVAEIKGGKSIDAVAAEVGAKVTQVSNVLRTAAQQSAPGQPPAYSKDFLGAMFAAKPGGVVAGSASGKPGILIAKLVKVEEPSPEMLAAYADAARARSTSALSQDLNVATRMAAVAKMKPSTDPKLARRALGVDADTDTPVPAKSKAR